MRNTPNNYIRQMQWRHNNNTKKSCFKDTINYAGATPIRCFFFVKTSWRQAKRGWYSLYPQQNRARMSMEGLPGAKAILKWSTQWTQETIYQTYCPTTYFIKLFTTYFITAWLAGSGAAGLSGLDGVSGLADRERHDYMDKKCDAYF